MPLASIAPSSFPASLSGLGMWVVVQEQQRAKISLQMTNVPAWKQFYPTACCVSFEYLELIFRRILTGCCYWPSARSFIGVLVLLIIKLPKVDFCLNHNLSELGKWELQFCIFFSSERTCYPERQFNKSFFFSHKILMSAFLKGRDRTFFFFFSQQTFNPDFGKDEGRNLTYKLQAYNCNLSENRKK